MNKLENLKVKIFADGANKKNMLEMYSKNFIKGLTTNPSLMKKEGISDYKSFCVDILKLIKSDLKKENIHYIYTGKVKNFEKFIKLLGNIYFHAKIMDTSITRISTGSILLILLS